MSDFITTFANAIATAEGFFVSGSRPFRNNNPGDLTQDITGQGVGFDGPFVIYATAQDGWNALYQQVLMMVNGTSSIYNPTMTIAQVASHYTATDVGAWANTVAAQMGVSVSATLNQLVDTYSAPMGYAAIIIMLGLLIYVWKRKG